MPAPQAQAKIPAAPMGSFDMVSYAVRSYPPRMTCLRKMKCSSATTTICKGQWVTSGPVEAVGALTKKATQ